MQVAIKHMKLCSSSLRINYVDVTVITYIFYLFNCKKIKKKVGWVQWLTPVIPALWEAEAGGSQGQEIETTLANTGKPRLY